VFAAQLAQKLRNSLLSFRRTRKPRKLRLDQNFLCLFRHLY
jgi:hypothetical protein